MLPFSAYGRGWFTGVKCVGIDEGVNKFVYIYGRGGVAVFDEYYNENGKRLGADAAGRNGKIRIVVEGKPTFLPGTELIDSSCTSAISGIRTSKVVIREAEYVLQKTIGNGGDKEERSVVTKNDNIHRAPTGEAKIQMIKGKPVIYSAYDTSYRSDGNTLIHSHPIVIGKAPDDGAPIGSVATKPGPDDFDLFPYYELNIIVGNLYAPSQTTELVGGAVSPEAPPPLVAVFYDKQGKSLARLSEKALKNIIK